MTFDSFGYWRESWTVKVSEAHRPLREAFTAFAAVHDLELDELSALETRTVRKPSWLDRLRGRDTTSRSLAAVTPDLVIWAVLAERTESAVAVGATLATVVVEKGMGGRIANAFPSARLLRGVSFTGVFLGKEPPPATAYLGFGREVDGDAFETRLREGMRAAGNRLHGLPERDPAS